MALALAGLVAAASGCGRLDVLNRRLDSIGDGRARTAVRDVLWAHGSKYRWAEHTRLRADVSRTVYRPLGDETTREVWFLDLVTGDFRIERPDRRQATVARGDVWRVVTDDAATADLPAQVRTAGEAHLVRDLLVMPFSLLQPGTEVTWAGTRTGPAEARRWQQLLVTYGPGSGHGPDDRAVVEIRATTGRVESALVTWSALPFAGRPMRVCLDDWRPVEGLLLARRWRFFPVDEAGQATGPARYAVRVDRIEMDPVGETDTGGQLNAAPRP